MHDPPNLNCSHAKLAAVKIDACPNAITANKTAVVADPKEVLL